jgi:hypothetical protein
MSSRRRAAAEQLADNERSKLIASGMFIHANTSDPVHYGKGRVSVYEHTVFLESDFEVGPGPAFHVYLVPKASIRSTSDLKDIMFVDLGGLRAFKGSQRYVIPAGVNLQDYQSVIIWCERFGVLISPGGPDDDCGCQVSRCTTHLSRPSSFLLTRMINEKSHRDATDTHLSSGG